MTRREDILGRGLFDVFPDNPDDPAATGVRNLRASLARVVVGRRADAMAVQKYDIRRPESEGGGFEERYWSPVNSPVLGEDGSLAYIIHRVEDVTEFVRLKQAGNRQESEIFLRAQQLAEANEQLRAANEEAARLYRQIAALMEQADVELRVTAREADQRNGTPAPTTSEDMLARVGRLIAGYKRLDEQLRHSQKMEAVGRLAGGIAHDFNNLLTVIIGYAKLVHDKLRPVDPLRDKCSEILLAAEHAALLTGQLLAFSRKQVTQPRVLNLNGVADDMKEIIQRLIGEDIDLSFVLDPSVGMVKADAGQLAQVLMNLVVNARDAMPAGGKLTVETRPVQRKSNGGDYAMLAVTDTGCGMDAETQAHLFEPFFTTKGLGKGTGLGLSTVHGIVHQHGGWIEVQSEPGKGSRFEIYLPVVAETPMPAQDREHEPLPMRTGTILLVEDQAAVRMLAEDVLSEAGHRVLSAGNGPAALRLAERHQGPIDLLITDVVMPDMSGPQVAAELTRSRPGVPVLYVSGYTDDALERHGVNEREAALLPKPFLSESLIIKVAELLRSKATADGLR